MAVLDQFGHPLPPVSTSRMTARASRDAGAYRGSISGWRGPQVHSPEGESRERDVMQRRAADLAQPGDVVLLAPAAASMDMFANYGARGDAFADAVVRLYGDASLWHRLSTNGRENIRRHFSLDAARNAVRRIFF